MSILMIFPPIEGCELDSSHSPCQMADTSFSSVRYSGHSSRIQRCKTNSPFLLALNTQLSSRSSSGFHFFHQKKHLSYSTGNDKNFSNPQWKHCIIGEQQRTNIYLYIVSSNGYQTPKNGTPTKRQVSKSSGFKTSGFKMFGFKTSVL